MKKRFWVLLASLLAFPAMAFAQVYNPDFDPSHHKGPQNGTPNQLLVLGSPHLSGLPETFKIEQLSPLIDRLVTWEPQMIAIEAVSGQQCDFMRHYPHRYKDSVEAYCQDTEPARAATGMDVPAASAEADRLLAQWPENPAASQRRHLAALFLASADQGSALVQWLRLPESERHPGDSLDEILVERLNKLRVRRNEIYQIAAPLAARLGLERLYPIDDHTADSVVTDEESYAAAITGAWDNPATNMRREIDEELNAKLDTPDGLLAIYRRYNAPEMAPLVFKSDFGAALEEPSPQYFGRHYLGYWETRNLRMSANIRDMMALRPGVRALVIVGASHKAYLESYLNQMHDVRLVDAEKLLR